MPAQHSNHETFTSRLGFLMLAAACAIGLGNVWRFPFITGKYGGGVFLGFYLLFLLAVLPVMIMEFAIGRASKSSLGQSFYRLEPKKTFWHKFSSLTIIGSYLLMMFYTTVSGWMLKYCVDFATSNLITLNNTEISNHFGSMLASPINQICYMTICIVICFTINAFGLRTSVERIVKWMMLALFALLIILVVRVLCLPNATSGLWYLLWPDLDRFLAAKPFELCNAAMSQAFFTLGIGIGVMVTIGSYYTKEKSLTGEALCVAGLDTLVAILAGMLIFPACFAYNINPDSGPGLIFITLPHVFSNMPQGQLWGSLFFLFMAFASFSTVIAVFETIIAYSNDVFHMSRKKASLIHAIFMILTSLPCCLGWSTLSFVQPLGANSCILDLEDFLVSSNILPLGALLFCLFCSWRYGWGWNNFIQETNCGKGIKLPMWLRTYCSYILPALIIIIMIFGYIDRFYK